MRVFKKRNRWWIDYTDPEGKRHRKSIGHSKREAVAALEKIRASILAGTYYLDSLEVKQKEDTNITLGEIWAQFRAGRTGVAISTMESDCKRMESILLPFFGKDTPLTALVPSSFAKFVRWREGKGLRRDRPVTKSTIARDLSVMKSMWRWGSRFLPERMPPSPIPKNSELNLPYMSPPRIDFLSSQELQIALEEAGKTSPLHLLPGIALGAFAGLRRAEITNLRWEDVDLETSILRIRNRSEPGVESRTKNEDDRMIPIRPSLAKILRSLYDHYLAEGGLPEFVLPLNKHGRPITTFIGAWKRLQKRCGLRQLSIHSLRHTCASHMVMAGIPLLSVARFLGHKSTVITERYAHLAPEHLSEEMNRVEKWHQEGTTSVEPKKRRNGSIRNSRPS